ncbi:hypothetical protein Tco_1280645 [Tanacetum coccineum]
MRADAAGQRSGPIWYADKRLGDRVLLKVSPWKGVVRFGKKGKLAPRYVVLFEIVDRKFLADSDLQVSLEEIKINNMLYFVEEPVEIMDRQVKKLKRSWIPLVKVRWNSRQGSEFTWERETNLRPSTRIFSPPPRLQPLVELWGPEFP